MNVELLYNIHLEETFGLYIAIYFYLTGLSAGSFIMSTLSYGFGLKQFKPLGKVGVVLATILLVIAPVALLLHAGQPLKVWHLFAYINPTSPISWGSFLLTLYPINCLIYGYFMFRGDMKRTRIFGLIGIPLAIMVHGYTGFILAIAKARALWNTALMPILFLVSAMVSGIAMMILVSIIKDRFFSKDHKQNIPLLNTLAVMLAGFIVFDLFLVLSDVLVLLTSHSEAKEAASLLLYHSFSPYFVFVENIFGKIIPLTIMVTPRFRTVTGMTIGAIMVMIGIFFMRYVVVLGGEHIPLI
ncbi:polysulfide reductase NrfD [candidate division KSB1 bacterium]|nr:polysulfide reductase NrfD [candidate division KSB1 bacterium]